MADNPHMFQETHFAAGFTLKDSVTEIASSTFLDASLPIGFKIPAGAKIYYFDNATGWSTALDNTLEAVALPANSQWSDPNGAVAGSEIVATNATA